jgi:hypothetical protein
LFAYLLLIPRCFLLTCPPRLWDLAKVAGQNGHNVKEPSPLVMVLDFALTTGWPTFFGLFSEGLSYESAVTVGGVQQVIFSLLSQTVIT